MTSIHVEQSERLLRLLREAVQHSEVQVDRAPREFESQLEMVGPQIAGTIVILMQQDMVEHDQLHHQQRLHGQANPASPYHWDLSQPLLPPRLQGKAPTLLPAISQLRSTHEGFIVSKRVPVFTLSDGGRAIRFEPSSAKIHSTRNPVSFAEQMMRFSSSGVNKYNKQWDERCTEHHWYAPFRCVRTGCHNNGQHRGLGGDHLQLCTTHAEAQTEELTRICVSAGVADCYHILCVRQQTSTEPFHINLYYHLYPQLDHWVALLDAILPINVTGYPQDGPVSPLQAHLLLQLRPLRQLLLALKATIAAYRMHLNPHPFIIAAVVALIVGALRSASVRRAARIGVSKVITGALGLVTGIFLNVGLGVLWTLDMLFTDDWIFAQILKTGGQMAFVLGSGAAVFSFVSVAGTAILATSGAAASIVAAATAVVGSPVIILGGAVTATVGVISWKVGNWMLDERAARGVPHALCAQMHINITLQQAWLWQWF